MEPRSMDDEEQKLRAWEKLLVRFWTDREFRRQATADPTGTLRAAGVTLPDGVQVEFAQATNKRVVVIIPPPPDGIDAQSDPGELERAASTRVMQMLALCGSGGSYTCSKKCS